jgi:DNA-directed RNA polymerase specialized sigma24 family protein
MTGFGESSYRRNPAQDPRELERLVLTYADNLVRYAYSIVGSSAVAEDVMEDTFALLMVKGGNFADEAAIRSWLYKVVHNQAILYLRRHKCEVPLQDVEHVLPVLDWEEWEKGNMFYLLLHFDGS